MRADLAHLGSGVRGWVGGSDGRAGSAPSAHRDALQQPLSRGERSKLLTAEVAAATAGEANHSNYNSYLKKGDQTSVCVTESRVDQQIGNRQSSPVASAPGRAFFYTGKERDVSIVFQM